MLEERYYVNEFAKHYQYALSERSERVQMIIGVPKGLRILPSSAPSTYDQCISLFGDNWRFILRIASTAASLPAALITFLFVSTSIIRM